MRLQLEFAIDSSGTPPGKVVVGFASFNALTRDDVLDKLFSKLPSLIDRKGRNLTRGELNDVLAILDRRRVRMVAKPFSTNDWMWIGSNYGERDNWTEKVFGMLYFSVIRKVALPGLRYAVTTCAESHLDIVAVHRYCKRIAGFNNIELDFSYGIDTLNRQVKVADFIAAAGRKLKTRDLRKIRNFTLAKSQIPEWVFWKMFK